MPHAHQQERQMAKTLHFIPGTMCDARVWQPVRDQLSDQFETAYIPLETARSAPEFRMRFHEAFEAAGEPLNLVAFSMGGYLALEFALEHPEKAATVITVCSSAFGLHDAEKAQRKAALDYLERHTYRGIADARIKQMVHPDHFRDEALKQIMRDMDHDIGLDILKIQLRETSDRADLFPRLSEITCPALVLGGDSDPFLTAEQRTRMASAIPQGQSAEAEHCGHMLPLEHPDWLAEQIRNFHSAG